LFGRSERPERRANDLNRGPVLINRTPRGYEAGIALKAGTAAALITDYERKAVAGRIPYLDRLDGSNDATELHDAPRITAPRHQVMKLRRLFDSGPAQLRRISDRPQLAGRPCRSLRHIRPQKGAAAGWQPNLASGKKK